jgi:hypothetical protein
MMRRHHLYVAPAALIGAAALFAGGFFAGLATADAGRSAPAVAQPFPDWFLPIWDAYDRNPAVTPDFDFAGLYSTEIQLDTGGMFDPRLQQRGPSH